MPSVSAPDLNVINVIDPEDYDVEIRPQELLQVVLVDKGNDIEWRYIEYSPQIGFKVLRTETLYTDSIERMTEGNFQVIPYTKKLGKLQHHFWFRINPDDAKEVIDLEERYFELATIGFYDVETQAEVGRVKVNMIMEAADKSDFIDLMTETTFAARDLVKQEAQTLGLSNNYTNEKEGYILNPCSEERVSLECRQRIAIIEIAQPPKTKTIKKWKMSGESAVAWAKNDNFLSVVEVAPRYVNGVRVQRFLARNELHSLPDGIDKIRLGEVSFSLESTVIGGSWHKKVIFSAVREREKSRKDFIIHEYNKENDEDLYDIDAYGRRCDVDSWLTCVVRRPNTEDYIVRKPRKVPVKIEEIDGTLTAGVKLIKVFLPPTEYKHYVCDHPKKKFATGEIVEIADPAGNTMVELNKDQKLIVMLYKDVSGRKNGSWELVNVSGGVLESRGTTEDLHRIQFWFEQNDKQAHEVSIIVFKRGDERRLLHVFLTGRRVKEIKTEVVTFEEENKILQELLMRESDYRTVTSLRVETEISEEKLQEALEKLEKDDRVVRHPDQFGLWGHKNRIAFGKQGAIELHDALEKCRCL